MSDNGCISIDVDTLSSIYKGEGCTRTGGYTFVEFRSGVENMLSFFEKYIIGGRQLGGFKNYILLKNV